MKDRSILIKQIDVSKLLGISSKTVYRLEKEDKFFPKKRRIGRTNYFVRKEVEQYLEARLGVTL